MEFLASLFVGKPLNIFAVAITFFVVYLVLRYSRQKKARYPHALLHPSIAWILYAAWEWLVYLKTPEANIRVDLLIIWPVLAIISILGLFRAFR
jgi:hypothetical protein